MVIKFAGTTFSSDLRKPCWITGKSLSPLSKKSPVLEKSHIYYTKQDEKSTFTHKNVIYNFHNEIDDSQLLTAESTST